MTGKSTISRFFNHQRGMGAAFIMAIATTIAACKGSHSEKPPVHLWQQMDNNQYYRAQAENELFDDGRAMRVPVAGTVARGELKDNFEFYRGRDTLGALIDDLPGGLELSEGFIRRGKGSFNIYCSPCHDESGRGNGMIQQHAGGFKVAPKSLHSETMRAMPLGHFFDVATHGSGTMRPYAAQIPEADRWAIAVWIRVLQAHGAEKGWNG